MHRGRFLNNDQRVCTESITKHPTTPNQAPRILRLLQEERGSVVALTAAQSYCCDLNLQLAVRRVSPPVHVSFQSPPPILPDRDSSSAPRASAHPSLKRESSKSLSSSLFSFLILQSSLADVPGFCLSRTSTVWAELLAVSILSDHGSCLSALRHS